MVRRTFFPLFTLFVSAAAVLLVSACGTKADDKAAVRLLAKDSYGREVALPENAGRIVSLSPSLTEILYVLDCGDRLVGRTDYCDYPPEAAAIASVGSLMNPNIEKIASLKPDLVLASDHFQKETLRLLESLGIPVFVGMARKEYTEIYSLIAQVGLILGKKAEAEKVVAAMKEKIERISALAEKTPRRPKVYYMLAFGEEGDYTAGRDSFISRLIRAAGGSNLGDGIEGWRYSLEGLFRDEPDIIVCSDKGGVKARLSVTAPYNRLRAVKEGRVYELDPNLIDRMGPRNADGLEALAKIFHPELFP